MGPAALPRAPVTCPHCGHTQWEPEAVIATVCRQCREAIQVRTGAGAPRLDGRRAAPTFSTIANVAAYQVQCFDCGTILDVPATAESTMCKRCSAHIDLRDYQINQAVSKNFRTHGRFVVREKGYVFNTDSVVGEAVVKGRFHGRLDAKRRLEIHTSAEIKGSIRTALLAIPAGQAFQWSTAPLEVGGVELAGELSAALRVDGMMWIRASGRFFGELQARDLRVEPGAVLAATLRVNQESSEVQAIP